MSDNKYRVCGDLYKDCELAKENKKLKDDIRWQAGEMTNQAIGYKKLKAENKRLMAKISPEIAALIRKYIGSSLKAVESCIKRYSTAKKYEPLMKTRGEFKQILKALENGKEKR